MPIYTAHGVIKHKLSAIIPDLETLFVGQEDFLEKVETINGWIGEMGDIGSRQGPFLNIKEILEEIARKSVDSRMIEKALKGDLHKIKYARMISLIEFQNKGRNLLEKFCDACNFEAPDWEEKFVQV